MEQIAEKKKVSVKLPSSYLRNIYATLIIANNRATWHPDELIPVGTTIKELKAIIQKCNDEESKEEESKEEESKEEESKEEVQEEESKEEESKEEVQESQ